MGKLICGLGKKGKSICVGRGIEVSCKKCIHSVKTPDIDPKEHKFYTTAKPGNKSYEWIPIGVKFMYMYDDKGNKRITVAMKQNSTNTAMNYGVSFCSTKDTFSKDDGREIACRRLNKFLLKIDNNDLDINYNNMCGSIFLKKRSSSSINFSICVDIIQNDLCPTKQSRIIVAKNILRFVKGM